jgi:hypothetical protein
MLGPRWAQKPPLGTPIDPSSQLAAGLAAFWAASEGTGPRIGDASGNGNAAALAGGASWSAGANGPAVLFGGAPQYAQAADAPSLRISPSITLATLICPTAYNPHYSALIQKRDASNPTVNYNYDFGLSPSGNPFFQFYDTQYRNFTDTAVIPLGAWSTMAASVDAAAGLVRFYFDGQPTSSMALTGTMPAGGTAPVQIGNYTIGSGPYNFSGSLSWAAIWSRALQPAEHAALAANPWQVFRPQFEVARLYAAISGFRLSYPRGPSILRPVHLPTADLSRYLD